MSKRKRNEDLILAQWQTYVEMANSVSQRRDAMNNVFITLNLALLTAVSLAWDIKSVFIIIAGIVATFLYDACAAALRALGDTVTPLVSSSLEMVGKIVIAFTLVPLLGYTGVIVAEPIVWFIMVIPLLVKIYNMPVLRKRGHGI